MKTFILHLCLMLLVAATASGRQTPLSGRLHSPAGAPVAFANVYLLQAADSAFVKGALTDEAGIYRFTDLQPGRYVLRFSRLGFQTAASPSFELLPAGRDMGAFTLQAAAQQLEEVTVRAGKPLFQQQPYGTIVNVENSVLTKGSSALEVLERSPGVYIDRRSNSIALNGKNGVMVMLNGKLIRMSPEQLVNMLHGMSANDIEKIELLNTPPAKYDAEGSGGVINIQLKKNRDQANISLTGGYGWGGKAAASAGFARSLRQTNVYGSWSYNYDNMNMNWFSTSDHIVPVFGGRSQTGFLSTIKPTQQSHNANAGFDMKLKAGLSAGGSVTYSHSHVAQRIYNDATYRVDNGRIVSLDADVNGHNRWNNVIVSLYADQKLNEKEQLHIDADYLRYANRFPVNAYNSVLDQYGNQPGPNDTIFSPWQRGESRSGIQVGVAKVDYSRQLGPKLKLEAGFKGTYTRTESNSGIESLVNGEWTSRTAAVNNIVMKEGIGAAYVSLNATLSPKLSLNAGGRYEYARTKMNDPGKGTAVADRRLGKFFPALFFTWKLKETSELQLSYTERISRPAYNDLASFVVYIDPTGVETGNPLLMPTIAHNFKLGYNYKEYTFSMVYSHDDHPIIRYQLSPSLHNEYLVLSPHNMRYFKSLSFQANLPVNVTKWWSMNYNVTGGWRELRLSHTKFPAVKSYWSYTANFSETFRIPAGFSIELSGWYNGPGFDGSKKADGFGMVSGGVKKEFSKNRGSLQLSVADIFKTFRITSYFGSVTEEAFDLTSKVTFSTESGIARIVKLTYSRSFGNTGSKSRRAEGNGSREERERVRN
ncbi:TonB-dependent receptor domain-containing protein [Chitinophaga sp. 22620]|uniref:TonB-dependent receptor domain-containing protein n=1 Tax=Chitinophaga sp. 22620 TaxID=3453952 RepID=UPI003F86B4B4